VPAPTSCRQRLPADSGVRYEEFSHLHEEVPVISSRDGLGFGGAAAAMRWSDGLIADEATVLARYDHPHLGRWPAATKRRGPYHLRQHGARSGLREGAEGPGVPVARRGMAGMPASVTRTGATAADGLRVHFLHNWSRTPERTRLPAGLRDVVSRRPRAEGEALERGPWDVRVLVQDGDIPGEGPQRQRGRDHSRTAVMPPSTRRIVPVVEPAAGEAREAMAWATSSAVTRRARGWRAPSERAAAGEHAASMRVLSMAVRFGRSECAGHTGDAVADPEEPVPVRAAAERKGRAFDVARHRRRQRLPCGLRRTCGRR
jgi:hypothetical protein